MRRIDLPDGHWADLREPSKADETGDIRDRYTVAGRRGIMVVSGRISEEGRSLIQRVQEAENDEEREALTASLSSDLSEEDLDTFYRLTEATVVALLYGWSLAQPLPNSRTVAELPINIYDALSREAAMDAAQASGLLHVDTSVGDGKPDPKEPSGDSAPSSGI